MRTQAARLMKIRAPRMWDQMLTVSSARWERLVNCQIGSHAPWRHARVERVSSGHVFQLETEHKGEQTARKIHLLCM